MTGKTLVRAGAIVLVASLTAACGAPYGTKRYDPVPGTAGRWVYDGKTPLSCNRNDIRPRHFDGDGHTTGHDHLGHGHKWSKRNFKGRPTKPPCYVRRAAERSAPAPAEPAFRPAIQTAGLTAATRHASTGDLS